jgi:hypothetical protein
MLQYFYKKEKRRYCGAFPFGSNPVAMFGKSLLKRKI